MSDESFRRAFGEQFFDRFWQLNPDWAMSIGYYKYADRLVVPDAAARTAAPGQLDPPLQDLPALGPSTARPAASRPEALAQLDRWLKDLRAIDPSTLSPAVRADRAMLETEFLAEKW